MSSKRKIMMPTDEEDAAINRGIAEDPDTYEVPAEDFKKMTRVGCTQPSTFGKDQGALVCAL